MGRILGENRQENGIWVQLAAPSEIIISPVLLWVMVSIAAIFFISGIFQFLHQFFMKSKLIHQPLNPTNTVNFLVLSFLEDNFSNFFVNKIQVWTRPQSIGYPLPVLYYKQITGLKDPFDCVVCLFEFSPHDQLRLIPICSHSFHTQCIDTWLLSNSKCPPCRANVSTESPSCNGPRENSTNVSTNSIERLVSVKLGKFKSFNAGERSHAAGEISRCYLDARRCFSMGFISVCG